jgi:DNA-binding PadR family transcriptional regulator
MAKRGDKLSSAATLSQTEYLIMQSLIGNGGREMYGLELVEKSEGRLKKGTVYVLLGRLEDKGFVRGRAEIVDGSAIPRRLYKPTGLGQKVFEAWASVAAIGGMRGAFA